MKHINSYYSGANRSAYLYNTLHYYGLYDFVLSYLSGGSFPDKQAWKSIVVERVYNVETEQWEHGLVMN